MLGPEGKSRGVEPQVSVIKDWLKLDLGNTGLNAAMNESLNRVERTVCSREYAVDREFNATIVHKRSGIPQVLEDPFLLGTRHRASTRIVVVGTRVDGESEPCSTRGAARIESCQRRDEPIRDDDELLDLKRSIVLKNRVDL